MTITTIKSEDTNTIIINSKVPLCASEVFISQNDINRTIDVTWRFIRDELNDMPDMYYFCIDSVYEGEEGKRFYFVGDDLHITRQAIDFIEGAIEHEERMPAIEIIPSDCNVSHDELPNVASANCPLFSK